MKKIQNYVHGQKTSISQEYIDVFDPSKGEKINEVVMSNSDDFQKVIQSALNAQKEWSKVTPLKRSRIISKYKNLLEENLDDLAKLVSQEHGKTLEDAKGSVTRGIEVVEFACGIPHLLKGEFSQDV